MGQACPILRRVNADHETCTIVLLIIPGVSMMCVASAIEPLRAANRLSGRELYRWVLASLDGGPIDASNGITLSSVPVEDVWRGAQYMFLLGGVEVEHVDPRPFRTVLGRAARHGVKVGGVSGGPYVMARAGLLNGYKCTIHWEYQAAFEESFPEVICTSSLFTVDRDWMTCSGGVATMDLMLSIIDKQHGSELSVAVCNQFMVDRIRSGGEAQRAGADVRESLLPQSVAKAIRLMRANLEHPLPIADIARESGVSNRQLERQFQRYLSALPSRHYLKLRLDRALELLMYSRIPVAEVALASGFGSTSHFARNFRMQHGVRPSEVRRTNGPVNAPAMV